MSIAIPPGTERQPNLQVPSHAAPRLLVSVRDSHEARLARLSGVDWIDLKNPASGALGAADEATAAAVAGELQPAGDSAPPPHRVLSAAVGELRDAPMRAAESLARYFPLLKVGLSGLRDQQLWPAQLATFATTVDLAGAQLVPVIYADHVACHAPTPSQIIEVARTLTNHSPGHLAGITADPAADAATNGRDGTTPLSSTSYLLIDTFTKDGRRLLDWMERAELAAVVQQAAACGRQTVVAGSLAMQDLAHLMTLPIAAIAVRGAVCASGRRSALSPEKLRTWVELFSGR